MIAASIVVKGTWRGSLGDGNAPEVATPPGNTGAGSVWLDCQGIHPGVGRGRQAWQAPCRHLPGQRDSASGGTTNYCIRRRLYLPLHPTPPGAFSSSYTALHTPSATLHLHTYHTASTAETKPKSAGPATLLEAGGLFLPPVPCRRQRDAGFILIINALCQRRYVFPSPYHTVAPGLARRCRHPHQA